MKFLLHTDAPWCSTGYGVQAAMMIDRLTAAGHECAVSVKYGSSGHPPLELRTLTNGSRYRQYQQGYLDNGNHFVHEHANHWFDGDRDAGWIIVLMDVWAMTNPGLGEWNVIAWTPVDHLPAPPDVVKFFHRYPDAVPVAMSRFGEQMLTHAGLDPAYIPLTVDTSVYRPTFHIGDETARDFLDVPGDAFLVGMVAMNKGWSRDRKGFNEAFRAFGQFWQQHNNAYLYVHTDPHGLAEGLNLYELAQQCGIPEHVLRFPPTWPYVNGYPAETMAALYTTFDVLLAPSHGEGFGVPLIEAQACGTPVIVTDFSSQRELAGPAEWRVAGQPEPDPPQHANYVVPFMQSVYERLEEAYVADLDGLAARCEAFAAQYDADVVFAEQWVPFIESLTPAVHDPKPEMEHVDVIVPAMRPGNVARLVASFRDTAPPEARLLLVVDDGFGETWTGDDVDMIETGQDTSGYATKVNVGVRESTADWVLIVGDDVEFTAGWFEEARKVSPDGDVIGTNDSEPGRVRNPAVAKGTHADHFFIRRAYIDTDGASLDGPGQAMPTAYSHWFVDREVVGLARARGVYVHAHDCRLIHHHPGYDGREDLRAADPVYMAPVDTSEQDRRTWMERAPLIEHHRVTRR